MRLLTWYFAHSLGPLVERAAQGKPSRTLIVPIGDGGYAGRLRGRGTPRSSGSSRARQAPSACRRPSPRSSAAPFRMRGSAVGTGAVS